jgi:lipopolysaccharide export system protein LptA
MGRNMFYFLICVFAALKLGQASSFKVQESKENITITSQQVEYETASQICHVTGQAKAQWDNGQVVTAHTFLILLNKKNEIETIEATSGSTENVTFQKDDLTMQAKKCVYTVSPIEQIHCFQSVRLVKKGANTLQGDECIMNPKTGHYRIISKTSRPVQAKVTFEKKKKTHE